MEVLNKFDFKIIPVIFVAIILLAAGCGGGGGSSSTNDTSSNEGGATGGVCGHDVDPSSILYGYNQVVDGDGVALKAQGKPLQEEDRLTRVSGYVADKNDREYARIASYMMPIRDALMCDLATTSRATWLALTAILTANNLKTVQDLSGTPKDQVYSTGGIYDHLLATGGDTHPMMKYLEEAELELKCLAFVGFDFTNPEGVDHCATHGLATGSGLVIPN